MSNIDEWKRIKLQSECKKHKKNGKSDIKCNSKNEDMRRELKKIYSHKYSLEKKQCSPNKILNPRTNNCVLRSGKIGREIIASRSSVYIPRSETTDMMLSPIAVNSPRDIIQRKGYTMGYTILEDWKEEFIDMNLDNCGTFLSNFTLEHVNKSTTHSDSIFVKLKRKKQRYFLKVFKLDNQGILYEFNIYKRTNYFLQKQYARNFMPMLAAYECINTDFAKLKGSDETIFNLHTELLKMSSDNRIAFILEPYIENSLRNYINTDLKKHIKKLTVKEQRAVIYSIFFQMYYSIYILSLYGINHNDLHASNIRAEHRSISTPEYSLYRINNQNVICWTKDIIPYIYDYDLSTASKLANITVKHSSGRNNKFMLLRDFLKLTCTFLNFVGKFENVTSSKDIISKTFKDKDIGNEINTKYAHKGCFFNKQKNDGTIKEYLSTNMEFLNKVMKDPMEILLNFIPEISFEKFKNQPFDKKILKKYVYAPSNIEVQAAKRSIN